MFTFYTDEFEITKVEMSRLVTDLCTVTLKGTDGATFMFPMSKRYCQEARVGAKYVGRFDSVKEDE